MSNTNKQLPNSRESFIKCATAGMVKFDEREFIITHPSLYSVIIAAINYNTREVVKYTLEQAAEKAELDTNACGVCQVGYHINKESILSLESQIIGELGL